MMKRGTNALLVALLTVGPAISCKPKKTAKTCSQRAAAHVEYMRTISEDGPGLQAYLMTPARLKLPTVKARTGTTLERQPVLIGNEFELSLNGMPIEGGPFEITERIAAERSPDVALQIDRRANWSRFATIATASAAAGVKRLTISLEAPSTLEPPAVSKDLAAFNEKQLAERPSLAGPTTKPADHPYERAWSRCRDAGMVLEQAFYRGHPGKSADEVRELWRTKMVACECAFDDPWVRGYVWAMSGRVPDNRIATFATFELSGDGVEHALPAATRLGDAAAKLVEWSKGGKPVRFSAH